MKKANHKKTSDKIKHHLDYESYLTNWRFAAKILLLILIMLFLLYDAAALGISPSTRKIYFEPGLEKEYYCHIINNEKNNISAAISVTGDMKDYILLKDTIVEMSSEETKKRIYYTLKLPLELNPGIWNAVITAAETIPGPGFGGYDEKGSTISATISVASIINIVAVPEGKYITAELDAKDVEAKSNLFFNINIENLGHKDISEVMASIDIYSAEGLFITSISTAKEELKKHSRSQIKAILPLSGIKEIKEGRYYANAEIYYDGLAAEAADSFLIGEPYMNIINASLERVGNNTYRFDTALNSRWNSVIHEASLTLEIADKNRNLVSTLQSAPFDIEPYHHMTIPIYAEIPAYNLYGGTLKIKASFEGKISEAAYDIEDIFITKKDEGLPSRAKILVTAKNIFWNLISRIILLIIVLVIAIKHICFLCRKIRRNPRKRRK